MSDLISVIVGNILCYFCIYVLVGIFGSFDN